MQYLFNNPTAQLSMVYRETCYVLNKSPPGQNGRHFADDIFRFIFVNEWFAILIKTLLKFIPKGLIHDNPALF